MIKFEGASADKDELIEVNWDEAFSKTASIMKDLNPDEIMFAASPFSTLEDNYALKKFAKEVFGSSDVFYIPNIDESFGDDLYKRSDKTPNSNGLKILGIHPFTNDSMERLNSGKIRVVVVLNDDLSRLPGYETFQNEVGTLIYLISNKNNDSSSAGVVFPLSTYAEINGTLVNFENRIQRIRPAVATLDQERLLGEFSMSRLDKFGAHNDRWTHGNKYNSRPGWKVVKLIAKAMGHDFEFDNSEEVFIELCSTIPDLNGYDYEIVGKQGIVAGEKITAEA